MYVYDTLVYNRGRGKSSMLYNLENWQLILPNNSNSFDARRGRPSYLENIQLEVNSYWNKALSSLDDETIAETFGDILDERRIKALAKRRDLLLADYAKRHDN
jgi:DNA-binding MurR/RpiR family transcriptional regulator